MRAWVLLVVFVVSLSAQPSIDPGESKTTLAPLASYFVDPVGQMEISDIIKPENQKRFLPCTQNIPSFGYSSDTYWIKIPLTNDSEEILERHLLVEYAALNHVTLYVPKGVTFEAIKKGTWYPEEIEYRGYSFPVRLLPKSRQDYYLQVKTVTSSITVPLVLWKKEALDKSSQISNYFIGLAMGALAVIGVYNLFLFFVIRDMAYLYYVGYVITMFFYEGSNSGIANLYFWPGNIFLNTYTQTLNIFAMSIFAFAFSHAFLRISESHPKISRLMKGAIFVFALMPLLALIDQSYSMKIATTLVGVSILVVITLGVYRYFDGYKPARYYLLAWGILAFAIVVAVLRNWGIIPTYPFTFWLLYWIVVFETVLLSFALADRITLFRLEKEKAQQALLENQRSMQATLEREVAEKTHHLEQSLEERETLFQELNHRVKNNMQVIASLLRLQASGNCSDEVKEKLMVARGRVQSMAYIHDLLYKSSSISKIKPGQFIHEIAKHIIKAFGLDLQKVDVKVSADEIELDMQQSVACALILNELLTNTMKHAFLPDQSERVIKVELKKEEQKALLVVEDNGKAKTEPIKVEGPGGLGLQLVNTLVSNQLNGNLTIEQNGMTRFTIEF